MQSLRAWRRQFAGASATEPATAPAGKLPAVAPSAQGLQAEVRRRRAQLQSATNLRDISLTETCRISDLCAALDVSRAGFYAWRQRGPSERNRVGETLGEQDRPAFRPQLAHHRQASRGGTGRGGGQAAPAGGTGWRGSGVRADWQAVYGAGGGLGLRTAATRRPSAPNWLGQRETPVERSNPVWAADSPVEFEKQIHLN